MFLLVIHITPKDGDKSQSCSFTWRGCSAHVVQMRGKRCQLPRSRMQQGPGVLRKARPECMSGWPSMLEAALAFQRMRWGIFGTPTLGFREAAYSSAPGWWKCQRRRDVVRVYGVVPQLLACRWRPGSTAVSCLCVATAIRYACTACLASIWRADVARSRDDVPCPSDLLVYIVYTDY